MFMMVPDGTNGAVYKKEPTMFRSKGERLLLQPRNVRVMGPELDISLG